MNRHSLPVAIAALTVVAAGCGSSGQSTKGGVSPASGTHPAAAPAAPHELLGQYTRFVTKADIARTQKKRSELGPHQQKPKPAPALMTFEPAALTVRDPAAKFVVQLDYAATPAGGLVIRGYQHPDVGSFCGPEVPQNATYRWKVSGKKLTVRAVADPCADRDSTLTGTWTRKG
jgi:hypothetical protein